MSTTHPKKLPWSLAFTGVLMSSPMKKLRMTKSFVLTLATVAQALSSGGTVHAANDLNPDLPPLARGRSSRISIKPVELTASTSWAGDPVARPARVDRARAKITRILQAGETRSILRNGPLGVGPGLPGNSPAVVHWENAARQDIAALQKEARRGGSAVVAKAVEGGSKAESRLVANLKSVKFSRNMGRREVSRMLSRAYKGIYFNGRFLGVGLALAAAGAELVHLGQKDEVSPEAASSATYRLRSASEIEALPGAPVKASAGNAF